MLRIKHKSKHFFHSLLGPLQKKKCPYCLGSFRLFEARPYQGIKNCPRCGSSLTPEFLRLPVFVLSLFPKDLSSLFQKRCLHSAFITALFHKKGYILTPLAERDTLFLVAKKGRSYIKPLCILRLLPLSETDFEENFPLRKTTDGMVLFMGQPKEESSHQPYIPKALASFLQYIIHPRTNKKRAKRAFPVGVVFSSLKDLRGYFPSSLSTYTENPSPEFKGDMRLFSGYIRSLLGFWYGVPLIHTLEETFPALLYSALSLEESAESTPSLSYEADILSFFLSFWGFKIRKKPLQKNSIKETLSNISLSLPSSPEKKKNEKTLKEKKDPSLRIEEK